MNNQPAMTWLYTERDVFNGFSNEAFMQNFQKMKTRRVSCKEI